MDKQKSKCIYSRKTRIVFCSLTLEASYVASPHAARCVGTDNPLVDDAAAVDSGTGCHSDDGVVHLPQDAGGTQSVCEKDFNAFISLHHETWSSILSSDSVHDVQHLLRS